MTYAPKQATGPYALHLDGSILFTFWQYWRMALEPKDLQNLTGLPGWMGTAGFALFTAGLAGYLVWAVWRKRWVPIFFFAWFAITLGPVLPLRDHVSSYYLTLPVTGLAMLSASALTAAWRGPIASKAVGAALAAWFLLISATAARAGVHWWWARSREAETLVRGVIRARELHPGKAILLAGVNGQLFGSTVWDGAFRTMGVSNVYLTPETEAEIRSIPEMGDLSEFFMSRALIAPGLARNQLVVYQAGGPRLRNITSLYKLKAASFPPDEGSPRKIDVANPAVAHLLGPTWYENEGTHRWMGREATLQIGGPRSPGEKLRVSGYCPAAQSGAGPLEMTVSVDGKALAPVRITQRNSQFAFEFDLPRETVGKHTIEIGIAVNRTFRAPPEEREMGLAFGFFEVR
jgi:hypothetical protein